MAASALLAASPGRRFVLLALTALAAAPPVRAESDPVTVPATDKYAVGVAVQLRPDPERDRLEYDGDRLGLPLGTGTVEIANQARTAYAVVHARMFEADGPAGQPALVVEVAIIAAGIDRSGAAGRAEVLHRVVVRDSTGAEVARWGVHGEEPITGRDQRAVSRAFARAAAMAASAYEGEFDGSARIAAWLATLGVARRIIVPPPPRFLARQGAVAFLDAGGGSSGAGQLALALRPGYSGERFLVALNLSRAPAPFAANPAFGSPVGRAELTPTVIGVDAGLVQRFLGAFEARGGLGVHAVGGRASIEYQLPGTPGVRRHSVEKWAPGGSAFVGVVGRLAPVTSLGLRGRIGVEGRLGFGGSIKYDAYRTAVTAPGSSLILFFGAELPVP